MAQTENGTFHRMHEIHSSESDVSPKYPFIESKKAILQDLEYGTKNGITVHGVKTGQNVQLRVQPAIAGL
jgi:hypothetical protein